MKLSKRTMDYLLESKDEMNMIDFDVKEGTLDTNEAVKQFRAFVKPQEYDTIEQKKLKMWLMNVCLTGIYVYDDYINLQKSWKKKRK
jgi:hypothetical protein